MYRQIPYQSKICLQKTIERDMRIHKDKVEHVLRSTDMSAPKTIHLLNKPKAKTAQEDQRLTEIERENSTVLSLQPKRSLNIDLRKRELVKTVIENQSILKRIYEKKSNFDIKKWEQDRKQNERYINNICEYTYKQYKPTKAQFLLGIWDDQYTPNKNNIEKTNNKYSIRLPVKEGLNLLNFECKGNCDLLIDNIQIDEKAKKVYFQKQQVLQPQEQKITNNYKNIPHFQEQASLENEEDQLQNQDTNAYETPEYQQQENDDRNLQQQPNQQNKKKQFKQDQDDEQEFITQSQNNDEIKQKINQNDQQNTNQKNETNEQEEYEEEYEEQIQDEEVEEAEEA